MFRAYEWLVPIIETETCWVCTYCIDQDDLGGKPMIIIILNRWTIETVGLFHLKNRLGVSPI